jgi:hypothetical protein
LRRDNDNYDYEGNGRMVYGLVGQRLRIDNNDSLNNRSTTTKEGGWDPPHLWQCCSGGSVEDCCNWHQRLTMVAVGPCTMMAWKLTTTGGGWRAKGPLTINDKGNQMGGATGVNGNGTGRATATAFASTSSATDWRGDVEVVAAFIVSRTA